MTPEPRLNQAASISEPWLSVPLCWEQKPQFTASSVAPWLCDLRGEPHTHSRTSGSLQDPWQHPRALVLHLLLLRENQALSGTLVKRNGTLAEAAPVLGWACALPQRRGELQPSSGHQHRKGDSRQALCVLISSQQYPRQALFPFFLEEKLRLRA